MRINLQYGREGLAIDLPHPNVTIIEPAFVPGLPDESAAFHEAVRHPIEAPPLQTAIRTNDHVAVVIPDLTRPLPSERLLTWLFRELEHVPAKNFTIITGTGSHRANTPEELASMVGADILARYAIVNHNAFDQDTLQLAGRWPDGQALLMNAAYASADRRLLLGFIEPHFMAGFSGGYKAAFPGVADIDSIVRYHAPAVIKDPGTTWGRLEGNPTQELIQEMGSKIPVDFLINVTLNRLRQITGFFCGDVRAAHTRGAEFSKVTAMAPVRYPFPVVVTTNSGYPLDQNLYQSVKGMSAAALITIKGGLIVEAARCNDGFPAHGNFRKLLFAYESPQELLNAVLTPGFSMFDQWEAQMLANIRSRCRVALFSDLSPEDVRRAHLEPITDVAARVSTELQRIGREMPIAVLPEGPMTIPYLEI
jgi:nickel-dependent lactate racemase